MKKISKKYFTNLKNRWMIKKIKYGVLQGRVQFPIGGKVRERVNAGAKAQDLVKFQNRQ